VTLVRNITVDDTVSTVINDLEGAIGKDQEGINLDEGDSIYAGNYSQ